MGLGIRSFEPSDEDAVVRLWRECGLVVPWNDPHRDIVRKLKVQPEMFLVGCLDGELVGTVMAGYEGHRGWINYLAVAPAHRRCGIGRALMKEAEARLKAMGCPKVNLQVRGDNTEVIEFYRRIGFILEDRVSLGKRLEQDE
jgi:ribosomal protein S18 acetylase RimI-like enzyme